ncbi:MAG: hypothetical protein ABEJ65_05205 [bacterium]
MQIDFVVFIISMIVYNVVFLVGTMYLYKYLFFRESPEGLIKIYPVIQVSGTGGKTKIVDREDSPWSLIPHVCGIVILILLYQFPPPFGGLFRAGVFYGLLALVIYTGWKLIPMVRMQPGELSVEKWPFRPGETVQADFKRGFRQSVNVETIKVKLQCRELVYYGESHRSTDGDVRRTVESESSIVHEETLETFQPEKKVHAQLQQDFDIPIPDQAMYSLDLVSNKIQWEVTVNLELSENSDADSTFEILVAPGDPND